MPDILIAANPTPNENKVVQKITAHLVSTKVTNTTSKSHKEDLFLATRYDEGVSYVKVIGFFVNDVSDKDLSEKYQDIIKGKDLSEFTEMTYPWHSINYVKSLTYRKNK